MAKISPDKDVPMSIETDEDDDGVSTKACGGLTPTVKDVLVTRPEYVWLRDTIETGYLRTTKAIVITGHPGIGKTVFLLQLLLHRLEQRLPTAIHLKGRHLVVFNQEGATIWGVEDTIEMTRDYWALSDSNNNIVEPCEAFQSSDARIIQASSPKPSRWKDWTKYHNARILVADLPRPLEIGAIVKELGLDVAETDDYIGKWDPCTRTILNLLSERSELRVFLERDLTEAAKTSARAICADPAEYANPVAGVTPSVGLFVLPYRPDNPLVASSVNSVYYIPTIHLYEIFNTIRRSLSNDKALQPFDTLSSHALTRAAPAWHFEKRMHGYLSSNSQALTIFREFPQHDSAMMQPS
ncbi:hypothetical protein C8T65DRAFT_762459 [Cerioporus squamosus]|nr:hypothetical protein C8T65DRAFT_762459 [Cerioporus squamosus]